MKSAGCGDVDVLKDPVGAHNKVKPHSFAALGDRNVQKHLKQPLLKLLEHGYIRL